MQTPEETLQIGSGSCRDSAWLLVQILRHLGLPARFVSGYLIQLKPRHQAARRARRTRPRTSPTCTPGPRSTFPAPAGSGSIRPPACCAREGPSAARGDAALPLGRADHRRRRRSGGAISRSRCGSPASPNSRASPSRSPTTRGRRSTRWAQKVDADLEAQDVRLTMGGEPTFVSIDDYQSAEWNTDALGPDQAHPRRRADPAAARPLRARRPAALRPGQMVSGRAAAALGLRAVTGARTASRSGATTA